MHRKKYTCALTCGSPIGAGPVPQEEEEEEGEEDDEEKEDDEERK